MPLRSWKSARRTLPAVVGVLALILTACGNDGDDSGGGGGGGASGAIVVSGSSTVEPITALVAELFAEENSDVSVEVNGPGTSDGFELFCQGETDINDASRAIEEEEITACEEGGVEYVELNVGIDGLSIITSTGNDDVECLTFADLYALVGPEAEGFDNWQQAQPLAGELGSTTELPDAPLDITGPGEESGTYGSFIELVFADIAEERVTAGSISEDQAETTRPDYQSSGNDNTIIDGVGGSDSSLGWVGYAFAQENSDQVKSLEVDGGDGCTAPTDETITTGDYPVSRPLFIYVNTAKAAENAALSDFVDFYLGDTGFDSVTEAGYINVPDDDWAATGDTWDQASG